MGEFTIGSTIYTKLSNDATITGYVGTSPVRIFPDVAPLNVAQTFPYIVYTVVKFQQIQKDQLMKVIQQQVDHNIKEVHWTL